MVLPLHLVNPSANKIMYQVFILAFKTRTFFVLFISSSFPNFFASYVVERLLYQIPLSGHCQELSQSLSSSCFQLHHRAVLHDQESNLGRCLDAFAILIPLAFGTHKLPKEKLQINFLEHFFQKKNHPARFVAKWFPPLTIRTRAFSGKQRCLHF